MVHAGMVFEICNIETFKLKLQLYGNKNSFGNYSDYLFENYKHITTK